MNLLLRSDEYWKTIHSKQEEKKTIVSLSGPKTRIKFTRDVRGTQEKAYHEPKASGLQAFSFSLSQTCILHTGGTVFPNTDRLRPANNVFIFLLRNCCERA